MNFHSIFFLDIFKKKKLPKKQKKNQYFLVMYFVFTDFN